MSFIQNVLGIQFLEATTFLHDDVSVLCRGGLLLLGEYRVHETGVDSSIDGCGLVVSQELFDGGERRVGINVVAFPVTNQTIVHQFRLIPTLLSESTWTPEMRPPL